MIVVGVRQLTSGPFTASVIILTVVRFGSFFLIKERRRVDYPLRIFQVSIREISEGFCALVAHFARVQ